MSTRTIGCSTTSCGDEGYWCPVGFETGNGPGSQRRRADVGLWETSDELRRRASATGTALVRDDAGETPRALRSRWIGGLESQDVGCEPGGAGMCRPARTNALAARCWNTPLEGVWIDSTLRCMTASFCRVPRPRSGVGAPAGVDLYSGRWRDGRTGVRSRQLEHTFCPCLPRVLGRVAINPNSASCNGCRACSWIDQWFGCKTDCQPSSNPARHMVRLLRVEPQLPTRAPRGGTVRHGRHPGRRGLAWELCDARWWRPQSRPQPR
ncbi:hypothetical protein L618_000100005670 [Rhodococcus rhodochrous J45]|uniref:Uncharacterized protein n=1 Tax=Rhodococcus rhodochrous J45 TaxID=935266 RepID=A0A562ET28_RHORH|nr:hypothetical protein L618_000100005670 [Rhodococcus rhodochrous J45]